jgi:hypothetical protein
MMNISIKRIIEMSDGDICIYPSGSDNGIFEYIYRTATGIRWDNKKNCFHEYEKDKWIDYEFIINTIISTKSEFGIILSLNQNTIIENLVGASLNKLLLDYYKKVVLSSDNYNIVYVTSEGNVREVRLAERIYLQTKYSGGDGDRPYIKNDFKQETPDNRLQGYCFRNKVPKNIVIEILDTIDIGFQIKDELQRVSSMGYDIDHKKIDFIKLVNLA